MREIKFRVWDNFRKKFAKQITTFKFDRCGNINLVVYLDRANKTKEITEQEKIYTNDFELMQYTGVKDKNGKEIYEGDIVKIDDEVYEIKWVGAGLSAVKGERRFDWWKFAKIDGGSYIPEIIGNVYENPELLEENND